MNARRSSCLRLFINMPFCVFFFLYFLFGLIGCTISKHVSPGSFSTNQPENHPKKLNRFDLLQDSVPSPSRGPKHSPFQVVELLDPCSKTSRALKEIRPFLWSHFPGMIRWTVRFTPSLNKDRGYLLSRALFSAERLGRFWAMLPLVPSCSKNKSISLVRIAKLTGLHPQEFDIALRYEPYKMVIDRDMRWGHPLLKKNKSILFLNGAPISKPYTSERVLHFFNDEIRRVQILLKQGIELPGIPDYLMKESRPMPKWNVIPEKIKKRAYYRVPLAVLESNPVKGPGDAPIYVVEFSDFTCLPCRNSYFHIEAIRKKWKSKVRFFYVNTPIGRHSERFRVAEMAALSYEMESFWPLYHLLFKEQKRLLQGDILALAEQSGLNRNWIAGELDRGSFRAYAYKNKFFAQKMRIQTVPTFFVNGRRILGAVGAKHLEQAIKEELWKTGTID